MVAQQQLTNKDVKKWKVNDLRKVGDPKPVAS